MRKVFAVFPSLMVILLLGGFPTTGTAEADEDPLVSLELRSMTQIEGRALFSLYDPLADTDGWVEVNRDFHGFTVIDYDFDREFVVVEYEGRHRRIFLNEAGLSEIQTPDSNEPESAEPRRVFNLTSEQRAEVRDLFQVMNDWQRNNPEASELRDELQDRRRAYARIMRERGETEPDSEERRRMDLRMVDALNEMEAVQNRLREMMVADPDMKPIVERMEEIVPGGRFMPVIRPARMSGDRNRDVDADGERPLWRERVGTR